jgi:hypothetical protein
MNGNKFTTFYKYPDPNYVVKNINDKDRVQKDSGVTPPDPNRRRLEGDPPVEGGDPVTTNDDTQDDQVSGDSNDDAKTVAKNEGSQTPKNADKSQEAVKFIEPSFRPIYTTEITKNRLEEYDKHYG